MTEDDWVISAMNDDSMVAELLIRLKHSSADRIPVLPTSEMLPPVRWGKYKVRSSSVVRKEKSEPMRCSPKTPLSWSGGVGGGGGTSASDLCEESSRGSDGKSIDRSKVDNGGSNSQIDKRFIKKMGYSELKEESMLKMEENIHLKKELEKLRMTVEEQQGENLRKKRKKIIDEFLLESSSTCVEEEQREEKKKKFILPDLNLVPVEEDDDDPIQSSWR